MLRNSGTDTAPIKQPQNMSWRAVKHFKNHRLLNTIPSCCKKDCCTDSLADRNVWQKEHENKVNVKNCHCPYWHSIGDDWFLSEAKRIHQCVHTTQVVKTVCQPFCHEGRGLSNNAFDPMGKDYLLLVINRQLLVVWLLINQGENPPIMSSRGAGCGDREVKGREVKTRVQDPH